MPLVMANEAGRAQIWRGRREANRCYFGRKMNIAITCEVLWKGTPQRVIAPYVRVGGVRVCASRVAFLVNGA
jgi:hypothetical protein